MAPKHLLTWLVALYCAVTGPSATRQNDNSLLERSYNLSQHLNGHERIYFLIELCHVSALRVPPARTKEWCQTLYNIAATEQDLKLRAVAQKNAAANISYVDPEMALELLVKGYYQRRGTNEWLYEDPRYNAADTIFKNLILREKGNNLSRIASAARYLGKTGQYPYRAVATLIKRLPNSETKEMNELMTDALGFYETETGFYNRDEEFLPLLDQLEHSHVDRKLASRATAIFVHHLTKDPIRLPGDYYAEVDINASGLVFPFTDRNMAFLFEAFPLIRRLNPALAAQLSQEDPTLNEATDGMRYISGGFVQGDPTSEEANQQHFQWLQDSLLNRIKESQDSNPESAARLAQRLTDVSARIVGFCGPIPAIAQRDPIEARAIYQKQLSELGNLGESVDRMRALVALVSAAYALGDTGHYRSLSDEAFKLGTKIYAQNVNTHAQKRPGFAELKNLVYFTAAQPEDILEIPINNLPDGWLKAYLWLYEAEAHQSSSRARSN